MTDQKETPGAGQHTGGEEETRASHPIIIPDSIPEDGAPGYGEGLMPDADPGAAADFLEHWRPGGPWVLTAIPVEGGPTRTVTLSGAGDVERWVRDHSGGAWNLYFTVNAVDGPVRKKPTKAEIVAATGFHVDVDPHPGEPLDAERERAERVLRGYSPPPTVVIDSGGGFQGFWRLDGEMPLSGDPLPVELRNLAIETRLQADACHNIDRIMRLPGTVNWPNKGKRDKGRVPRLARVVDADWSRTCSLGDLPMARAPSGVGAAGAASVVAAADVDLDRLPLPDRVRALVVNGDDADDPRRWTDRSRLVFHVACEMVRAGLSDAEMKAVLTDPDLGISAHVRDQSKPDRYADRQIGRARDEQPPPGPTLVPLPMVMARAFRNAMRPEMRHHMQEFLNWDGAAYVAVANDTVRAAVWRFLETCRVEVENELKPLVPKPEMVSATIDALRAVTHLERSREEPPRWLDGRTDPDPMELLPTRSGVLHLPTGDLLPATPALFTRNALDFAHDPAAPLPERWLRFLGEVWPDPEDADCIAALQEFMGYLLTPDTGLQKALLIPGPKRSGKGTIGRVMGKLVGEANTVAPSLNSLGRGEFGLEPLLAKQLAIVSDMRLSGRTDEAAVAENLLRITGEDRVSVNRKHRSAVDVTLRTRFVVMTNEVPKFADRSGALVSRFIVLPMRQSFFGREDPGLSRALMAELPGILLWAIDGWRRVRERGRITQPEAGGELATQMTDLASPIAAFLREWCDLGPERWVEKDRLFAAYREWHERRMGQPYHGLSNHFAKDLYAAADGGVRDSKRREAGERVPGFAGVGLVQRSGSDADMPF